VNIDEIGIPHRNRLDRMVVGGKPMSRGQQLAYVHFDDPRSAATPLTRDEARRIAANIAKLQGCC